MPPRTINDIFKGFSEGNLGGFIPVIVAIGMVTLLAGVVGFISAGDNEEKRSQGQKVMTFGIVVLFVMISYWGFVGFFTHSFFGVNPSIPNYLPPPSDRQ
ncbi:MAG: hypothetical protein V4438_04480 [Patescibacteria group bacterium]